MTNQQLAEQNARKARELEEKAWRDERIIGILFKDAEKSDCEDCIYEEDCILNNPDFDANSCKL